MVIMFLADGFEECEALCPLDMLRRAGLEIKTVSVMRSITVMGTHGICVSADMTLDEYAASSVIPDAVILPGGMPGALNLRNTPTVIDSVNKTFDSGKLVCAICAAPFIFGDLGILRGKNATCFPGFEDKLIGAKIKNEPVVTDGNIITARSMGAAYKFGFAIVSKLCGEEKAAQLAESMIY